MQEARFLGKTFTFMNTAPGFMQQMAGSIVTNGKEGILVIGHHQSGKSLWLEQFLEHYPGWQLAALDSIMGFVIEGQLIAGTRIVDPLLKGLRIKNKSYLPTDQFVSITQVVILNVDEDVENVQAAIALDNDKVLRTQQSIALARAEKYGEIGFFGFPDSWLPAVSQARIIEAKWHPDSGKPELRDAGPTFELLDIDAAQTSDARKPVFEPRSGGKELEVDFNVAAAARMSVAEFLKEGKNLTAMFQRARQGNYEAIVLNPKPRHNMYGSVVTNGKEGILVIGHLDSGKSLWLEQFLKGHPDWRLAALESVIGIVFDGKLMVGPHGTKFGDRLKKTFNYVTDEFVTITHVVALYVEDQIEQMEVKGWNGGDTAVQALKRQQSLAIDRSQRMSNWATYFAFPDDWLSAANQLHIIEVAWHPKKGKQGRPQLRDAGPTFELLNLSLGKAMVAQWQGWTYMTDHGDGTKTGVKFAQNKAGEKELQREVREIKRWRKLGMDTPDIVQEVNRYDGDLGDKLLIPSSINENGRTAYVYKHNKE